MEMSVEFGLLDAQKAAALLPLLVRVTKMNKKRHKNFTLLLGSILAASLLVNITQILIHDPKSFIEMFKNFKGVGMPWIPYISLVVIFLSALGAVGLMKYRQWGFYSMYLSYLAGALVAWFPFFPGFMLQFATGRYNSVIMLILIFAILIVLIYLHWSGKRGLYFKRSAEDMKEGKP
jgi:hypothetical protein